MEGPTVWMKRIMIDDWRNFMKAWNKTVKYIVILLFIFFLTACGRSSGTNEGDDTTAAVLLDGTVKRIEGVFASKEENSIQQKINDYGNIEKQTEVSAESRESETERNIAFMKQNYIYKGEAVLTKDNIEETMNLLLYNSYYILDLEEMPLTERFFNECIEHPEIFSYVEKDDIEKMKQFKVSFWGIREDGKCVCLCEFIRTKSYVSDGSLYYVVMDLEDDRIDSMEVTLVKKYDPVQG